MSDMAARLELGSQLRRWRAALAKEANDRFLERHPEWLTRYGEAVARDRGEYTAGHHVDFLVGAVEAGAPEWMEDYAQWCCQTLKARNISAASIAEHFDDLGASVQARVSSEAWSLVEPSVRAAVEACSTPAAAEKVSDSLRGPRRVYLGSALEGRRLDAVRIALDALDAGHSAMAVYTGIFQEGLYEIGRLWQSNRITVADEHLVTAITQYAIARTAERLELAPRHRGRAVITGVAGERHQVGGAMVSDIFDAEGWDVRFLGTDMPTRDIVRAAEEHGAALLGISVTMPFNARCAVEIQTQVRDALGADAPAVVLGGAVVRRRPQLWQDLGLDGGATDLAGARRLAAQFAPDPPR